MPDLDVLESGVAPGWYKPYRLLIADAEPEEVGVAVLASLTKCLREEGGLPGLNRIAGVVAGVRDGEIQALEAYGELRCISRDSHGHRHTKLAERVAERLIGDLRAGGSVEDDAVIALADGFCREMVDHHLFERSHLQAPAGPGSMPREEHRRLCEEFLGPHLNKLAAQLAQGRDPRQLRAPSVRRGSPKTTAELLDVPIT